MTVLVSLAFALIALIAAVPLLFRWHRFLRQKTQHKFIAVFGAMFLTAASVSVAYIVAVTAFFAATFYYPDKDFDRNRWLTEREKRFELSEDLIESRILVGKNKAAVKQLLGDEENDEQSNYWRYYLGYRPTIIGIDPDVLDIYFQDGKVVKVEQHQL
ncbi:hypothetical protein Q5H93_16270 [Hymenobacter sp. ASUV-10]|uniref:Outer membrane protein assembly factor BamE n=1 Tax=Hymenobacter aranciens TaxID=3063996 RepID=A0ABT9BDF6_9BACT|nr:hypothetical protein [Hymenobacter sp. ASUV-10]MDO7876301.1 hypothetical protein [Hymenobacter sp. ASUV-10]